MSPEHGGSSPSSAQDGRLAAALDDRGRHGLTALALEAARALAHEAGESDVVTGLRTKTHMGHPDWAAELGAIAAAHAPATVPVFYCGPPGLGRKLRRVCARLGMPFRQELF